MDINYVHINLCSVMMLWVFEKDRGTICVLVDAIQKKFNSVMQQFTAEVIKDCPKLFLNMRTVTLTASLVC